ncbi:hypothetical protein CsSME_00042865 [Camellia sinensis var. sinensis]
MKNVKVVNVQRVESGCAWRKLNVQRVLDESTKNHVKMRSKEAEKKLRPRKSEIFWRDAKYGPRIKELSFLSFFIF